MKWLLLPVIVYALYGVAMIRAHPSFIYPFGADPFQAEGWRQERVGDVTLAVHDAPGDVAVLFFMGNGGALAYFTFSLAPHEAAGRRIVALEYRGGGGIAGTPSEHRLKADALVAYDRLAATHDGPVVVHGYSMGTGLALHVAARRDPAAVILDAPFVKMCRLMARASYLPACYMPFVQTWNSGADVAAVRAPVLVQHGMADRLIPITEGQELAQLLHQQGVPVEFHGIEGATHSNLAGQAGYADRIDGFLGRVLK